MKKLLVICDSEKTYGKRLYEYMLKRQMSEFCIRLYTSVELMGEDLKGSIVDVLMIDEASYMHFTNSRSFNTMQVLKTKVLTSRRTEDGVIAENNIYKYQPAKELINAIAKECGLKTNEPALEAKKKLIL